jgi:hypothetical protein
VTGRSSDDKTGTAPGNILKKEEKEYSGRGLKKEEKKRK